MILVVKLLFIIITLILLVRLKFNLSGAIFLVTLLSIGLFGINLWASIRAVAGVITEKKTWELLLIIFFVLYIGIILREKRMFSKLVDSLHAWFRDHRLVAMIGPSIIGLLPSPGGALLSAPIVEAATTDSGYRPEFRTFLNYWFRHFWELIWPAYTALLIFQTLSNFPLKRIILYQLPFPVLNMITGWLVARHFYKKNRIGKVLPPGKTHPHKLIKDFFSGIWPLMLIILMFFAAPIPFYISLAFVSVILTAVKRISLRESARMLFSGFIIKNLILIGMIMIFQKIIGISSAFDAVKNWSVSLGLIVFFCFFMAFSMGFLTGVNVAYVAIAYPILLPLIQHLPNFFYLSLYINVIGFAGILLSPLHLCLVLSNEYFKSSLTRVYAYLIFPVATMIGVATLLVLIL